MNQDKLVEKMKGYAMLAVLMSVVIAVPILTALTIFELLAQVLEKIL